MNYENSFHTETPVWQPYKDKEKDKNAKLLSFSKNGEEGIRTLVGRLKPKLFSRLDYATGRKETCEVIPCQIISRFLTLSRFFSIFLDTRSHKRAAR
jgi:hypothetical protein